MVNLLRTIAPMVEVVSVSKSKTFTQVLAEGRRRLLRSLVLSLTVAVVLWPFSRDLFGYFTAPLWRQLPPQSHLIAIDLCSSFWVPIELSFCLALMLTVPWWLLELWWWVSPGLYRQERRCLRRALCLSFGLFWLGVGFAYEVILPLMIGFFLHAAPVQVVMLPDIAVYLAFSLRLLLSFGIFFELPLLIYVLVRSAWVSKARLASGRRYVCVAAFVVGMMVAPDPFSQCLLALPLYGLYEVGLYFARAPKAIGVVVE